jgi:hypothetical protein
VGYAVHPDDVGILVGTVLRPPGRDGEPPGPWTGGEDEARPLLLGLGVQIPGVQREDLELGARLGDGVADGLG